MLHITHFTSHITNHTLHVTHYTLKVTHHTHIADKLFSTFSVVRDEPKVFVNLLLQVVEDRMRLRQHRVRQRQSIDAPPE